METCIMARKKMARKRKPQEPSPETIKLARGFAQKHNVLSNGGRWKGLVPEVSDDLLGADMKTFRVEKRVKQVDVASRMKVEACVVSNLEAGRLHWNAEKVLKYVDAVLALKS